MRRTDPEENTRSHFRSPERVFSFNCEWYFATREGDCGPYASKDAARAEVTRYISERDALSDFQNSRTGAGEPVATLSLVPLESSSLELQLDN